MTSRSYPEGYAQAVAQELREGIARQRRCIAENRLEHAQARGPRMRAFLDQVLKFHEQHLEVLLQLRTYARDRARS